MFETKDDFNYKEDKPYAQHLLELNVLGAEYQKHVALARIEREKDLNEELGHETSVDLLILEVVLAEKEKELQKALQVLIRYLY